jgi:hypothetical protein
MIEINVNRGAAINKYLCRWRGAVNHDQLVEGGKKWRIRRDQDATGDGTGSSWRSYDPEVCQLGPLAAPPAPAYLLIHDVRRLALNSPP